MKHAEYTEQTGLLSGEPDNTTPGDASAQLADLQHAIEHAAHLLPSQAPIRVFVHHNTLHSFEDQCFEQAVQDGAARYGCHPFLPEDRYREKLSRGRILAKDISAVLIEDLGELADQLIGVLGTRYQLRLAMLRHPLRTGTDAELRWMLAESDALRRFDAHVPANVHDQVINRTRRWVMRDLRRPVADADPRLRQISDDLFQRFNAKTIESWPESTWEAFTLHLLWYACHQGAQHAGPPKMETALPLRHRDYLLQVTGHDIDRDVDEELIRYCAAFVDQGVAHWPLPGREQGFYRAWINLYRNGHPLEYWLKDLPAELHRLDAQGIGPLASIEESLALLGVEDGERDEYLTQTVLALRGWAGMLWQMETNAEWTVLPAPSGTLVEYVAVRLVLERLALGTAVRETLHESISLCDLRARLQPRLPQIVKASVEQRAFQVFQLAQTLGWLPADLYRMPRSEWSHLIGEIEAFPSNERRRIYHQAFERRYRNWVLDAIGAHGKHTRPLEVRPSFQLICCLDEREESFRRHLEEVDPGCETFGAAGFFGVAMYYRGVFDAHYVPLCPIVMKPGHYVQEEVVYSFEESHRRQTGARRAFGRASHRLHNESRSIVGGALAALFGSLASIPLVTRVLFPRLTARIRRLFARFVQPTPMTRLLIERGDVEAGPQEGHLGYSLEEMVSIAERILRDMGLTTRFARVIVIAGHGSSSLNNPHRSAYDCGACGGGRGGPNARALAGMLNDPRVRERLAARGLTIRRETVFVGGFHNTCDDSLQFFDLDRLPSSHRNDFEHAKRVISEARRRNAHERCRRFESAELFITPDAALRHVEGRSEDLSQVRPELGHATNAVAFVGRRWRVKGLFLDRRTFLTSYDATQDDEQATILTRILQAVIPVCAGINLEYFFCYVDPTGYGSGSKLPHNITSLVGVMEGAASDLRPGLPWQMVEIHEPVRLLFVIEAAPQTVLDLLARNPALDRLVRNRWVQLSVLDPHSSALQTYREGAFEPYEPEATELPTVPTSADWYRGWRDHLGFASVVAPDTNHRPDTLHPNAQAER